MSVEFHAEQAIVQIRAGATRGLARWAQDVADRAVKHITQDGKSGRIYARRGVQHQASAPGEPPASDTGRLASMHEIEIDDQEGKASIKFTAEYAPYLEFGTRNMEPRPFLRRSLEESTQAGLQIMAEEIKASTE